MNEIDKALEAARGLAPLPREELTEEELTVLTLAEYVIATREAITDAVSTWRQHRDNPHIPPELRRALDALAEQRTS